MKLCTLIGSLAAVFRADASALTSGPDSKVFVLEVDRDVESPFVCDAQLPAMFRVEREIVASLRASPFHHGPHIRFSTSNTHIFQNDRA